MMPDKILGSLLKEQYTLDFGAAGIDPPLIPTVNVPPIFARKVLAALLRQHPDLPLVSTWHRCADGDVEIRLKSKTMDVGEFARTQFNGSGTADFARFRIHCSTVSL